MLAITLFYLVALTIAATLTLLTLRQIRALHPRFARAAYVVAFAGSVLWPIFPLVLNQSTVFSRISRALLAPPWFYWLVVSLLYSALTLVVAVVWLPLRRRVTLERLARPASSAFLACVLVATLVGAYHALVPLRVERVVVPIKGLPDALNGYRIAVMSDLHVGFFTRRSRLQRFVRETNELRPDVTLITGDLIDDDPHWVPKLDEGLAAIASPTYAVLGNHEIYGDPAAVIARMKQTRIQLLVNEGRRIGKGTSGLWLAGLSDFAAERQLPGSELTPDIARALAGRRSEPIVLFAHQPKAFDLALRNNIPLTIVGHTHGGQFGIRPLGWSLAGVFLPYHMGLYRRGDSLLYINTGTGYWVLPFRVGMTPEITLVTLRSASQRRDS